MSERTDLVKKWVNDQDSVTRQELAAIMPTERIPRRTFSPQFYADVAVMEAHACYGRASEDNIQSVLYALERGGW